MLDPRDARILQDRLKNLGPIQIRDIDEAQHRLVEATEKLRQNLVGRRPVPAARRAA